MDTLLGLSGTVMMLVEVLSRILTQTKIPDEMRKLALLIVSIILGIIMVATSSDVLRDPGVSSLIGILPDWLQTAVAGVLVGMGAKFINEVYAIANKLRQSIDMLSETRKEEARAMRAGTIQFVSGQIVQTAETPTNTSIPDR